MKKILKKSIAILLSLLMLSTGLVSAFADDNNCKLTIGGQIYAGTQKTATAQIKGLDKNTANEIKSSGGFDWKALAQMLQIILLKLQHSGSKVK